MRIRFVITIILSRIEVCNRVCAIDEDTIGDNDGDRYYRDE